MRNPFLMMIVGAFGYGVLVQVQSPTTVSPRLEERSGSVRFDVASVKLHPSGDSGSVIDGAAPNRFAATNVTLDALIVNAYKMPFWRLDAIPGPIATARFDVTAITDRPSTAAEKSLMLQNLLEERFRLVLKRKEVEGDTYVLLMDRSDRRLGPNIKSSSDECTHAAELIQAESSASRLVPSETRQRCFAQSGSLSAIGGWQVKGMSMSRLAASLAIQSAQTILDQTDLQGVFDFQLRASVRDLRPVVGPPPIDTSAGPPSILSALREQLGLKLERRRGPVERFVVEHAEMPTPD